MKKIIEGSFENNTFLSGGIPLTVHIEKKGERDELNALRISAGGLPEKGIVYLNFRGDTAEIGQLLKVLNSAFEKYQQTL